LSARSKYGAVARNIVHVVKPPRVDQAEIEILSPEGIEAVRVGLAGHWLRPIVEFAIGTGMRRGELCGLQWECVDLDKATVRVECSLEETAAGLRVKEPKTRHGRRPIPLARITAEVLREHYRQQLALRLQLGVGRPAVADYVFPKPSGAEFDRPVAAGSAISGLRADRSQPQVASRFVPALRHTHASTLIAAGVDILTVSRRLGHGRASVTLMSMAIWSIAARIPSRPPSIWRWEADAG
jgi:integrase